MIEKMMKSKLSVEMSRSEPREACQQCVCETKVLHCRCDTLSTFSGQSELKDVLQQFVLFWSLLKNKD